MIEDRYIQKSDKCVYREIDGETAIMTEDETLHLLNKVGTRIWELSDGTNTVSNITTKICEEFDVEEEIASRDTLDFIDQLIKKSLCVLTDKQRRRHDE